MTWHTVDSARELWVDAETISDDLLDMLLDVARDQVIVYAPCLADPDVIPTRYAYGQLRQTQNLWNAGRVDGDGQVGDGGFVFRPHPLDWHVKQILRPRHGRPRVR